MKTLIDINTLPDVEKRFYLEETWCPACELADLGITNVEMYLQDGHKYISGNCKVCGERCSSEIIEKTAG